jgi:hypothetical protein
MTVANSAVIDAIGVSVATGALVLTMTEDRDWTDCQTQLEQLQEKVSLYLRFVQSEQLYETHGEQRGAPLEVDLVCQYPPPESIFASLRAVAERLLHARIAFRVSVFPPGTSSPYELSLNAS